MYWPSPEETEVVSHCERSNNDAGRNPGDRRSVYQSMSSLLDSADCGLTESRSSQFSALTHTPEAMRSHGNQQWRPSPADGDLSLPTLSRGRVNTTDDLMGCYVTDCRRDSSSTPE